MKAREKEDEALEDLLSPYIPPGYKLTDAARARLIALAECTTRNGRRVLRKQYEKHPIDTFERDNAD